jgi:glycyl-tRNA synthetase beta chain
MTENITNDGVTLLLEIGFEEIPAGYLSPAVEGLKIAARKILDEYALTFSSVACHATPRRLALIIHGVPAAQETRTRQYFGPPAAAAFDKDNKPTKAALAFAASHDVEVGKLLKRPKPALAQAQQPQSGAATASKGGAATASKGEYVCVIKEEKGLPVIDIAASIFTKLAASIQFPKTMRWANFDARFARPIKWILALCGSRTVRFNIGGIESSNCTFGHRFLSGNRPIPVSDSAAYLKILADNYVVLDAGERKRSIQSQVSSIAAELGAAPVVDDALLNTVMYLVEYPVCVAGKFSGDFLKLPKELLISVMRNHQKYFALEDGRGGLINTFVVTSNTLMENADNVVKGAERVIRARLDDARFYYDLDLKMRLDQRAPLMEGIVFHERLGTLADKAARLTVLSGAIYAMYFKEFTGAYDSNFHQQVEHAARLAKADLTTGVVRQFPELQGLIGKYYALQEGHDEETAAAIFEHYMPVQSGGEAPATVAGTILSLADKLDNVVSFFSVQLVPSGSEDPFALRRQAMGIVSILIKKGYSSITLGNLISIALDNFTNNRLSRKSSNTVSIDSYIKVGTSAEGIIPTNIEIGNFFRQRAESYFSTEGYPYDVVAAAIHDFTEIPLCYLKTRMDALVRLKGFADYNPFQFALKRVHNIIPEGFTATVDESIFENEWERALCDAAKAAKTLVEQSAASGDFPAAINILKTLIAPINTFFDNVLVMDKDEKKKTNRLALLKSIKDFTVKVADFSKLLE